MPDAANRSRRWLPVLAAGVAASLGLFATLPLLMIAMPKRTPEGSLPALVADERALGGSLERHVRHLAGKIGERNVWRYDALQAVAEYLRATLGELGYTVSVQRFQSGGRTVENIAAERRGLHHSEEIIVVGAHYDTVLGCPGANDNATGVAAMLELAATFAGMAPARTLRFVAFANEEPPFFQTDAMGSLHYARAARERGERIVAMLSLETIGAYSDAPRSQQYPLPLLGLFYPREANFIAFVTNVGARALVRRAIGAFRRHSAFPSAGAAVPGWIAGVGWSDHWAFWQHGYPAIMITDTALFRYVPYHTADDTPDKIDYDRMTRVVAGLRHVVRDLVQEADPLNLPSRLHSYGRFHNLGMRAGLRPSTGSGRAELVEARHVRSKPRCAAGASCRMKIAYCSGARALATSDGFGTPSPGAN